MVLNILSLNQQCVEILTDGFSHFVDDHVPATGVVEVHTDTGQGQGRDRGQ